MQKTPQYDVHVVVGLIKSHDKLLVSQRPNGKSYSGYWEFPGGKVEANESSFEALQRELNEELGIQLTKATPWMHHYHAYPDKTVFLDIWLVENFLNHPQSQENQLLQWVTHQELMMLNLLEGNKDIIDKIIYYLKQS